LYRFIQYDFLQFLCAFSVLLSFFFPIYHMGLIAGNKRHLILI